MPEASEYSKHIQAYALGCLDMAEYSRLQDYLASGESYPWQELGEYQNLAALLPSILNMEMPSPVIKDNVARRLYRVRDEIKHKRGSSITSAKTPEAESEIEEKIIPDSETDNAEVPYNSPAQSYTVQEAQPETRPEDDFYANVAPAEESPLPEEPANEPEPEIPVKHEEFEVVKPVRHTTEFFTKQDFNQESSFNTPAAVNAPDDFYSEPNPVSKSFTPRDRFQYDEDTASSEGSKSSAVMYITIILLLLMIGGGIYAYLKITADVKSYKNEVGRLNKELKTLTSVPDENKDIQKMMELPDTKIINLANTKLNPGGFGKVIINSAEGAGYLQFGGMPEQSFTLWITSGKNPISLGTFKGLSAVQYIRFDLPELNQKQKYFILTPEVPGAEKPGKQVYLYGEF